MQPQKIMVIVETKERILTEVGKMFMQYGIRSVTMDGIAKKMGLSKRTLYENFEDKDDLVRQVVERERNIYAAHCNEIMNEDKIIVESMFEILMYRDKYFSNVNMLYFEDLKKYYPKIFEEFIVCEDRDKSHDKTVKMIKRAMKEGVIVPDMNVEILRIFVDKIFEVVHLPEFREFNPGDVFKIVFLSYMRGISTDKGRELIDISYENYKRNKI